MNWPDVRFPTQGERTYIRNLGFDPRGGMAKLPRSRLKRWWLKRRGWVFYGDDCEIL